MDNLSTLRAEEFPLSEEWIYFNHAAISPTPQRTKRKMQYATEQLANQPSAFFGMEALPQIEATSSAVASHINAADPSEIAFVPSTSVGVNLFAQSLPWQPGDNIVLCDMEFPSNAYPWMNLTRDGVEVRQVPSVDGGLELDALKPFVDENTRLIAASAVQFFSGHRTDISAVGQFCHEHGILFAVDTIQSIGHIPIDVQAQHIDMLATGGQKSLLVAPGTGFIYMRSELADTLDPRIIGGNATVDFLHWLDYDMTRLPAAGRFNLGTPNVAGIFGIAESLALLAEIGVANIDAHTSQLAGLLHDQLTEAGFDVVTPRDHIGPIVTFASQRDSEETDAIVAALAERKVMVGKHFDKTTDAFIRASFHCYNSAEEVEQFMHHLKAVYA